MTELHYVARECASGTRLRFETVVHGVVLSLCWQIMADHNHYPVWRRCIEGDQRAELLRPV